MPKPCFYALSALVCGQFYEETEMRLSIILLLLCYVAGCAQMESRRMSEHHKRLYQHNNNDEYCETHPKDCIENIPWH